MGDSDRLTYDGRWFWRKHHQFIGRKQTHRISGIDKRKIQHKFWKITKIHRGSPIGWGNHNSFVIFDYGKLIFPMVTGGIPPPATGYFHGSPNKHSLANKAKITASFASGSKPSKAVLFILV